MNRELSLSVAKPTRVRYGVLAFACALSMITYLDRVCMSTVAPNMQREFQLNDEQVGWIFFAFAFSYALFEIPSGLLGDLFGPRKTLIRIVLWWSFFTAVTGLIWPTVGWPWLAFGLMVGARFLFGMGEAGAYPNITRAFQNWFPFRERGSAQGAVWMSGRFAGGVTTLIVLALLVTARADDGREVVHWRHTFWIFGLLGVGWCVLFWMWFRNRPEEKPGVNAAELKLIRRDAHPEAAHFGVPWGRLFGNVNLWLLCLMYFCASYGWYFNITWLPKFLKEKYHVSEGAKWSPEFWAFSLMTGLPLLLGSAACLVGGLLTDLFIRGTGNRKWGRRLFGLIGHGLCAVCYFLSLWATNPWLFVLAIALAAFWNDLTMGSAWASCQDIGKRYAGTVSGCMNTIGNLGGAAAGYATGKVLTAFIEPAKQFGEEATAAATRLAWQVNFCIFASVYVLATLCWLGFDATKPVLPESVEPAAPPDGRPAGAPAGPALPAVAPAGDSAGIRTKTPYDEGGPSSIQT